MDSRVFTKTFVLKGICCLLQCQSNPGLQAWRACSLPTELHLQQHACDVTVMVFPLHEKGLQSSWSSDWSLVLLFPLLSAKITRAHPSGT